jgi:hypothetical protein
MIQAYTDSVWMIPQLSYCALNCITDSEEVPVALSVATERVIFIFGAISFHAQSVHHFEEPIYCHVRHRVLDRNTLTVPGLCETLVLILAPTAIIYTTR